MRRNEKRGVVGMRNETWGCFGGEKEGERRTGCVVVVVVVVPSFVPSQLTMSA